MKNVPVYIIPCDSSYNDNALANIFVNYVPIEKNTLKKNNVQKSFTLGKIYFSPLVKIYFLSPLVSPRLLLFTVF